MTSSSLRWVLFQFFFIPGLTLVSLLESEPGFEIVTQLATPENDHLHLCSLWVTKTRTELTSDKSLILWRRLTSHTGGTQSTCTLRTHVQRLPSSFLLAHTPDNSGNQFNFFVVESFKMPFCSRYVSVAWVLLLCLSPAAAQRSSTATNEECPSGCSCLGDTLRCSVQHLNSTIKFPRNIVTLWVQNCWASRRRDLHSRSISLSRLLSSTPETWGSVTSLMSHQGPLPTSRNSKPCEHVPHLIYCSKWSSYQCVTSRSYLSDWWTATKSKTWGTELSEGCAIYDFCEWKRLKDWNGYKMRWKNTNFRTEFVADTCTRTG
jgi:hypothetical protein